MSDDEASNPPGLREIILLLLKFIVFTIILFLANFLILPKIKEKIFPNLPPLFVWITVFVGLYEIIKAVFHYIIAFIVIVWVVYKFIEMFIPNIPFPPLPLKDIVLGFPPFKEFKELGIIDLLDSIYNNIFSRIPFVNRITNIGSDLGKFVAKNVSSLADDIRSLIKTPKNQKTYPDFDMDKCIKDDVDKNCKLDIGSNPITIPVKLLRYAMCRFIYLTQGKTNPNCMYKKCINDNIKPIYDTDTFLTKSKKRLLNMKANLRCSMKKNVGGAGVGVVKQVADIAFTPFDEIDKTIGGIIPEFLTFPFKPIFELILMPITEGLKAITI